MAVWEKRNSAMDTGLKWFTRVWIGLVISINIAGITAYAITAQSIWDLVDWIQQTYSPFNIWNHALNLLLVSPAVLTYIWRKKRNNNHHLLTGLLAQEKSGDTALGTLRDASESKSPSKGEPLEPERIINEFGNFIEDLDYMSSFYDVNKLPYPKENISKAIIQSYKMTADGNMREVLKIGLLALSHFQEDIGDSPVQGELDLTQFNLDELSPEEYLKKSGSLDKERFQKLLQKAEEEYQHYLNLL